MHDVFFGHHDHVMAYVCGVERIDAIHSDCLNLTSRKDYHGPCDVYVAVFSYDHHRCGVFWSHHSLDVSDDVFFGHHDHMMAYVCGVERINVIHSDCSNLTSQKDYHGPCDTYVAIFSYDHHRCGVFWSRCSLDVGDDVFVPDCHRRKRILPHPCLG